MIHQVNAGTVVELAQLVSYQPGQVARTVLAESDQCKLVLMGIEAGHGLDEHAAPSDALFVVIEGEAQVIYEGVEHMLHVGETIRFDKGGRHSVRAVCDMKFALLLV
ncbi:cupin domain-containing protein [Collinsella sp. zg1085]|uniref:cupin domain-containing protein n=1 Tax=Collinsella sp. zg1085 TaxID=2844380 RepID=UPI001C0BA6A6|nr:cupin domain-containing protein [Collinsella sp. zg1085]QWT17624.1 cupin domain-containing protein [Collinsella sp. zg1085]